ncbi:GNAT family N-acetyltransferase [Sorangium sp. So ce1504]|uniref:GNAT family N-acetyltransferase n=1 Tax=Sorangium sp. So ce1504 TaxID=3133337 RepID=UPI003F5E77D5
MAGTLLKTPSLTVRSPAPVADATAVIEIAARTFGSYASFRADCAAWYVNHSHYDWDASVIGFLGDAMVTHWGVWGYRMRIGRAEVRCGGIGAVATEAAHRGKGLMARTAPHSLDRMRARGYHLSILFGIDDFYHRFGYVPAWPESRWRVKLADLPATLPRLRGLRRIPAAPTQALVRLHNRWNAGLTGTAVRPTFLRSWSGMRKDVEAWCWGADRERPDGHVVVQASGSRLVCAEATGAPDAALSALGALCRRKALPGLRFDTLPYRSALAARLRTLNSRYEQRYAANGAAMVRVVDLPGCLAAMAPELSARLAASELAGYRGALTLASPEETATLRLDRGRVEVVRGRSAAGARSAVGGGWAVARLLLGSDAPLEVCDAGKLRLAGDAARLVPVLFPAQHPQLTLADRF